MSRIIKKVAAIAAAVVFMLAFLPTIDAQAADDYMVTYRSGDIGTFDTSALPVIDSSTGVSIVDSSSRYVKIAVTANSDMSILSTVEAAIINAVSIEDGYELLDAKTWGYQSTSDQVISKNHEFILGYGRLVDPVKYTIRYVNVETGEQIAPPRKAYGSLNESISYTPLSITGYTTTETAGSFSLTESGIVKTINYSPIKTEEVVTNTIVNYIYQDNGTTTTHTTDEGTATTDSNDAGSSDGSNANNTNNADTTATGTTAGTTGTTANVADTTGAGDETATIADDESAADDSVSENGEDNADDSDDTTTIEEEESAKAASAGFGNTIPVVIGLICLIVIVVAVMYLGIKRKKETINRN